MMGKIAWRNIWRHKRRSIIVILAITIGLWGMVISNAFWEGMAIQQIENAIKTHTGHLQIHRKGFEDNMMINLNIDQPERLNKILTTHKHIKYFAPRVKTQGMASTAEHSAGIMILGIDPEKEINITDTHKYILKGDYLKSEDKNSLLIGQELAHKLKVTLDDKIVLMAQALDGDIGSGAFRVKGIFKSASPEFDEFVLLINIKDSQKLLSLNQRISEIAVIIDQAKNINLVAQQLKNKLNPKKFEVLTWMELLPVLLQFQDMLEFWIVLSYIIVFIVVAIGIINILLMAIFERIKEFGVMRALGTKPWQISLLIILESIFIGFIGLIVGGILSYIFIIFLSKKGLDLTYFTPGGAEYMGFSPIIYPIFTWKNIIMAISTVFLTTLIVSIYPAIKAAKLKPIEALRFI